MTDLAERKISDAEAAGRRFTTVEMLAPLRDPMGSVWAVGERAGFPAADAEDLIRRGLARRAPARPEQNKMIDGATTQKK